MNWLKEKFENIKDSYNNFKNRIEKFKNRFKRDCLYRANLFSYLSFLIIFLTTYNLNKYVAFYILSALLILISYAEFRKN